jgi:hypothetical protein
LQITKIIKHDIDFVIQNYNKQSAKYVVQGDEKDADAFNQFASTRVNLAKVGANAISIDTMPISSSRDALNSNNAAKPSPVIINSQPVNTTAEQNQEINQIAINEIIGDIPDAYKRASISVIGRNILDENSDNNSNILNNDNKQDSDKSLQTKRKREENNELEGLINDIEITLLSDISKLPKAQSVICDIYQSNLYHFNMTMMHICKLTNTDFSDFNSLRTEIANQHQDLYNLLNLAYDQHQESKGRFKDLCESLAINIYNNQKKALDINKSESPNNNNTNINIENKTLFSKDKGERASFFPKKQKLKKDQEQQITSQGYDNSNNNNTNSNNP